MLHLGLGMVTGGSSLLSLYSNSTRSKAAENTSGVQGSSSTSMLNVEEINESVLCTLSVKVFTKKKSSLAWQAELEPHKLLSPHPKG